jgi:hypothetical protein
MRKPDDTNPCEDQGCDCCIRFREAWTPGSIYRTGDAVPYNGSSYVAIHWNQNDPPPSSNWSTIASKGDAGPAGPAGAQGPAGASGVSDVYTLTSQSQTAFQTSGADLASLNIPAGAYVIMGTIGLADFDSDDQTWTIELRSGDSVIGTFTGRAHGTGAGGVPDTGGDVYPENAYILAPYNATGETTLTLRGYAFNTAVASICLVAMKVGTIHAS